MYILFISINFVYRLNYSRIIVPNFLTLKFNLTPMLTIFVDNANRDKFKSFCINHNFKNKNK